MHVRDKADLQEKIGFSNMPEHVVWAISISDPGQNVGCFMFGSRRQKGKQLFQRGQSAL
jgi:hypothetical protein